ncbi:PTS sugar transporter subunit IIA [Megalodesulfovibrio paquesii]
MAHDSQSQPRTGVVVVTHADYGAHLLHAAEFILGPQTGCAALCVDNTQSVDAIVDRLKDAVIRCDEGQGVLLLTDMFGGTPTNLSLSLLGQEPPICELEVVTGVNLPMLLKALGARHLAPAALAVEVKKAGGQGIVVAGELLRARVKGS